MVPEDPNPILTLKKNRAPIVLYFRQWSFGNKLLCTWNTKAPMFFFAAEYISIGPTCQLHTFPAGCVCGDIPVSDGTALMPHEWNLLSISEARMRLCDAKLSFYIRHYFFFYFPFAFFNVFIYDSRGPFVLLRVFGGHLDFILRIWVLISDWYRIAFE